MRQMLGRVLVAGLSLSALIALTVPAFASAVSVTRSASEFRYREAPVVPVVVPTRDEQAVIDLVNDQRAKAGLHALTLNTTLTSSARGHSKEMASKKYFSHYSYNGERYDNRIVRYGYTRKGYSSWAADENIYWGCNLFSTPVAVVQAWMGSPTHRAVILDPKVTEIGVGATFTSSFKGQQNVTIYTLDAGSRTQ